MEKVIMIVFASMMMFTFTQCGNSNNNNQGEIKGSKEYRELCAGLSTCLKAIDKAQDCRELKQVILMSLLLLYRVRMMLLMLSLLEVVRVKRAWPMLNVGESREFTDKNTSTELVCRYCCF